MPAYLEPEPASIEEATEGREGFHIYASPRRLHLAS